MIRSSQNSWEKEIVTNIENFVMLLIYMSAIYLFNSIGAGIYALLIGLGPAKENILGIKGLQANQTKNLGGRLVF